MSTVELEVAPSINEATVHFATLSLSHRSAMRTFYRVDLGQEHLVTSADPEHAACRVLAARGLRGLLCFRWKGASHDASAMDIETSARLAVHEGKSGLRPGWFECFAEADR